MSYTPQALGISWGDLISEGIDLFKKSAPALRVGVKILQDPYLPEAACEVMRLSNLEAGKPAGKACARTRVAPADKKKGVGLRYAVGPLRAFIFHKQYPWVVPVVVIGTLGGIFYLGYKMGKKKK